jgi:hypothetical protein
MADVIATVLTNTKSISREANHHVYKELVDLQTLTTDPALASPYLLASSVSTVSKTTNATSGNFTLTLNFPKAGVSKTTANIAFNAAAAAIQTAIDNALNGETIASTYSAGDVDAAVTGNISANAGTITANGTTVNGYNLIVTTANVDLDAYEMTVTQNTVGTQNRPAEAALLALQVAGPSGTLPYQGQSTVEASEYELKDNPFSVSPALQAALVQDMIVNEDKTIGAAMREALPCVENR